MPARPKEKNIILIIDVPTSLALATLNKVKAAKRGKFKFMLLYSRKRWAGTENKEVLKSFDIVETCNFNIPDSIIKAVSPYKDRLLCVYTRAESQIENFQKVIPHVPYLRTPTSESLEWSINKYKMRRRFAADDKSITPKFMRVKDQTVSTIKEIEKRIGFPLMIKPAGLAQSILVTNVYHKEELETSLRTIFKKINKAYKDSAGRGEPVVLVEQLIEGSLFSIDGYISSRGKIVFCPLVSVKTGKEIGFDDYFGYQQMTPTTLTSKSIDEAERVSGKGVRALGLRSTVFHAELIKNDRGFKIIEIGPRIGGFRHDLYEMSYGFNHRANAVLVGVPIDPIVSKKVKGHSATLKIFAKKEGRIIAINGAKKIEVLKSIVSVSVRKKVGSLVRFASNGGKSVININLFNKERSKLLADIRRIEKTINIKVK